MMCLSSLGHDIMSSIFIFLLCFYNEDYSSLAVSRAWKHNHSDWDLFNRYMDHKKEACFPEDSLPYLWKSNVHATSQINKTNIGDVSPKVLLRTGLSVWFFLEIELGEQ